MTFTTIDWIIFLSVPLFSWIISRRGRSPNTWRGYFLASSNLSTTGVAATYYGANLTFTAIFLVLSEEAYKRGNVVFCVPFFWFVGTIIFILGYNKIKPFILEGLTLHQALGRAFNSISLQRWASVWTIVAFVGTVSLEFFGGIKLLQWVQLPGLANISLALLLAIVVSALTVTGGFRGVAWADRFLDVVSFTGAGILLWSVLRVPWSISPVPSSLMAPPSSTLTDNILFIVGMAILFLPFQYCTLDSWQRLGAWKNRTESPAGFLLLAAIGLCLVYCVPILVGLSVRSAQAGVPLGSHPLKVFLDGHSLRPGIVGLLFAGFVAAMFGTADELLNCCSLSLLFDTMQIHKPMESAQDERRIVAAGKFYTALFGFVAAIIALAAIRFERKITDISIAVFSAQVVFTLPIAIALLSPRRAARIAPYARNAMIAGFVSAIALVVAGWMLHDRDTSDAAPIGAFLVASAITGAAWIVDRRRNG